MKAAIFDMDGTLTDSEPLHFLAAKMVLQEFDIEISESDFHKTVGMADDEIWRFLIKNYRLKADIDDLLRRKDRHYLEIIERGLVRTAGLLKFLDVLKADDIRMAVVSSANRLSVDATLKQLEIYDYFDITISADDVTEKKPSPEPYLLCLKNLGLGAEDCIVFEDSPAGVKSAKAAGMRCVALLSYFKKQALKNADFFINSFEDINELVKQKWIKVKLTK
jgi:beta-phosphoglucomutase